jgi:K+-transporting ATPase ATPase B chain
MQITEISTNYHLYHPKVILKALLDSLIKLRPTYVMRNPIMFVVWLIAIITLSISIYDLFAPIEKILDPVWFTLTISLSIWFVLIFANFAESIAEFNGKQHAQNIRKFKEEITARKFDTGEIVPSSMLNIGDIIKVSVNEIIPCDGEVIDGIAAVDESVITGESAPVIKENLQDKSSVVAGTKVVSDFLIIRVLTTHGHDYLTQMLKMVDATQRNMSPNERAINYFLMGFTIIYIFMCFNIIPLAAFLGLKVSIAVVCSLLICVMPTTAAALIAPIAISGVEKLLRRNILAVTTRALDVAGDINVLLIDKTGTITIGNRMASEFIPMSNVDMEELAEAVEFASYSDETPEGKSIMKLVRQKYGMKLNDRHIKQSTFIPFSAASRISGCDYKELIIRKGAVDAICKFVENKGGKIPRELFKIVQKVGDSGGTPLVVSKDTKILGVIHLKDKIRPGIASRIERLEAMGIRIILTTGDNFYTAQAIAQEAGIKEFICEAEPDRKLYFVQDFQKQGLIVAVTGDGINDAPALAQADVGFTLNSSSKICKEAANIIDLDNDPMKIIDLIEIGREVLTTRGCLTTFSLVNDIAKYFAIVPAIFLPLYPELQALNLMNLHNPHSAIMSASIFNALIIVLCIPIALTGVRYRPIKTTRLVRKFFTIFGIGGVIIPFLGIKMIDLFIQFLMM